jgi:hypothetical protein
MQLIAREVSLEGMRRADPGATAAPAPVIAAAVSDVNSAVPMDSDEHSARKVRRGFRIAIISEACL